MSIDILSPIRVGPYTLPNRVFMAPLTRCRAGAGNVPHALNAEYYAQRASAGLIISEATQISPGGAGYPATPGLHSDAQVEGWKLVTRAVHERGGRIFAQLWHVGRVSHNAYQPDGGAPYSSSEVAKSGQCTLPDGTTAPYPTPRALTTAQIRQVMADYRRAAENALRAGFDGVELHGANGYLPDQFLRDGVNRRTDEYGGSSANRSRFHLEATRELCAVWGADRVGVRLSPSGTFGDMRDSDTKATFGHLITELGTLGLAYLHIMEAMEADLRHGPESLPGYEPIPVSHFRPLFKGVLVTNSGFTREKADAYIREGAADAVAFGVAFIANPDLPERFRARAALNTPDPSTFYGGGAKGYTDYPTLPRGG
jgi:N-ethylmaleimide reductase